MASAAIGLWLMITRPVFGTVPPMSDSDHLVGALIVTAAVIAMAEVARPLRFINIAFGLWLVLAPWLLAGESLGGAASSVVAGIAPIGLGLPRSAEL